MEGGMPVGRIWIPWVGSLFGPECEANRSRQKETSFITSSIFNGTTSRMHLDTVIFKLIYILLR